MPAPFERRYAAAPSSTRSSAAMDEGLRGYMLSVYNYMASGVLLTGIVAALVAATPALSQIFYTFTPDGHLAGYTILGWVAALAPLGFVFFLGAKMGTMTLRAAQICFWSFAGLFGLSLASIFYMYTGASLARVFFISAASFGALSLWGYTTKKDISGWGSFLVMGVFGIIIASIVNIFLHSSALYFVVSAAGVLIFAGLTAYDAQRIKDSYYQVSTGGEMRAKLAVMGALSLYLDFINLFLMLLRLFGDRR